MSHTIHRPLLLAAAFAATVAAACSPSRAPSGEAATLVLRNGRIVTVDSARPEAQAIAMRGATMLAVGSNAEIDRLVGDSTEVIDLQGRLAVPGLIESHGHYMGLGRAKMILDLTTAKRWENIVEDVAMATRDTRVDSWIYGRGWHQEKWEVPPPGAVEGNPVHDALSKASPNNPVVLTHASGHASFVNKRAMELANITRRTPNPPGGEIVKGPDGEPTGLLRETAQRLVGAAQARADSGRSEEDREKERRTQVRLAAEEALSKGVTSFHDAGSSFETIDFLKRMEAEGALPIRLYVMVRRESNAEMDQKLPQYFMPMGGDDYLTVRSIKRQIDGALGSHGAWLLEPYIDLPESHGLTLETPEDIEGTANVAIKHGFQVNTHAIGDRANRVVLDIYEKVFKANPDKQNLRWRIEHAQHLAPADVPRFAQLGVVAAMQGTHATSDGPWIPKRLGPERAIETSYRFRDLIKSGAVISNGTDVPVEDIDPIASFYAAVSLMMNTGKSFNPDQRMTREEALRSYTINAAYAAFEEERKGSLTPGKLGDIAVLSKDIMTVPEAEIPTAVVDLTVVGGKVKYRREQGTAVKP
ncbi:MAG: Amidohydrolase 3 [Geminicoccaceae bacterium]|nr:Amidohydrolase 3 [Geminicoccaceae bacterium]